MGDVGEDGFSVDRLFYLVENLVGLLLVQGALLLIVPSYLDVVQVLEVYLGGDGVPSAVPGGTYAGVVRFHPGCQVVYLGWVVVSSHEAHAGDSNMPCEQCRQGFCVQLVADVFPEILAVASFAAQGALTDADSQGNLVRDLQ